MLYKIWHVATITETGLGRFKEKKERVDNL